MSPLLSQNVGEYSLQMRSTVIDKVAVAELILKEGREKVSSDKG